MVDNRSAGFFGIGGAFNFKSGDISGTAAKMQDDKMGQGTEYFAQGEGEEEQYPSNAPFIDRSAQLRATLNSLAMMNVANVLNERKIAGLLSQGTKPQTEVEKGEKEELDEEFLNDFDEGHDDDFQDEENEYS